jgi:hypothetical protein
VNDLAQFATYSYLSKRYFCFRSDQDAASRLDEDMTGIEVAFAVLRWACVLGFGATRSIEFSVTASNPAPRTAHATFAGVTSRLRLASPSWQSDRPFLALP